MCACRCPHGLSLLRFGGGRRKLSRKKLPPSAKATKAGHSQAISSCSGRVVPREHEVKHEPMPRLTGEQQLLLVLDGFDETEAWRRRVLQWLRVWLRTVAQFAPRPEPERTLQSQQRRQEKFPPLSLRGAHQPRHGLRSAKISALVGMIGSRRMSSLGLWWPLMACAAGLSTTTAMLFTVSAPTSCSTLARALSSRRQRELATVTTQSLHPSTGLIQDPYWGYRSPFQGFIIKRGAALANPPLPPTHGHRLWSCGLWSGSGSLN